MRRPTVVLFDVDGTLVTTGGAGRRAMAQAFTVVHGSADALEGIGLGGATDRAILREALSRLDLELTEARFETLIETYLGRLVDEVERSPGYRVLTGARRLLEVLSRDALLSLGLGTGNVREGALIKLRRGSIDGYFQFGGFGSDAEARPELLRMGFRRGAECMGLSAEKVRKVVVGDTPKDVDAAHAVGAECLAVATGTASEAELFESGAERVVRELSCSSVAPFVRGETRS
jgi:phosphoglycolate phosphatase-like HAD superfamily hydrolase